MGMFLCATYFMVLDSKNLSKAMFLLAPHTSVKQFVAKCRYIYPISIFTLERTRHGQEIFPVTDLSFDERRRLATIRVRVTAEGRCICRHKKISRLFRWASYRGVTGAGGLGCTASTRECHSTGHG